MSDDGRATLYKQFLPSFHFLSYTTSAIRIINNIIKREEDYNSNNISKTRSAQRIAAAIFPPKEERIKVVVSS